MSTLIYIYIYTSKIISTDYFVINDTRVAKKYRVLRSYP